MPTILCKRTLVFLGLILTLAGAAFLSSHGPSWAQERKFERKGCLDCHKKFSEKYLSLKNLHPGMKEGKCEDCHLRHGIVPKLLLKKDGNELCYSCHSKDKIGLNQPKVHTVLKTGKCTSCHNPHGSQGSHLLKAEGPEACYQCHKKEAYQQKVSHAVIQKDGCRACHRPHSSGEPDLLVKAKTPLCLSCHDPGKGPFRKAHGSYPVENSSCTGCHDPHSSSQKMLLKASAHNPVVEKSCDACHPPPDSKAPFAATGKGGTLCSQCHDESKLKAGGTVLHGPFGGGSVFPVTILMPRGTRISSPGKETASAWNVTWTRGSRCRRATPP